MAEIVRPEHIGVDAVAPPEYKPEHEHTPETDSVSDSVGVKPAIVSAGEVIHVPPPKPLIATQTEYPLDPGSSSYWHGHPPTPQPLPQRLRVVSSEYLPEDVQQPNGSRIFRN
jgi:hypothetical protein